MTSDGHESANEEENPAVSQAEAALKARLGRRRTKTGCLTCRKRRIKCGEERPVCKNCVKSRRACEGYTQRVLFRPHNFEYQANGNGAHITFPTGPEGFALPYDAFSPLQPRPMIPPQHLPPELLAQPPFSNGYAPYQQFGPPAQFVPEHSVAAMPPAFAYDQQQFRPIPPQINTAVHEPHNGIAFTFHGPNPHGYHDSVLSGLSDISPAPPNGSHLHEHSFGHAAHASTSSWSSGTFAAHPEVNLEQLTTHLQPQGTSPRSDTRSAASSIPEEFLAFANLQPTPQLLQEAAVEVQDDDYYDVESDDSSVSESDLALITNEMHNRLQLMSTANSIGAIDASLHNYDSFLHNGMLDTYRVEWVASPLRNPATARVFMHFLTATGPSLSPFERSASILFSKGHVPLSQRGLWTYTMPQIALQNQGLLHAMLALGSLHIARLQGSSATPSMQHYAWSLKRIHNAVVKRNKRLNMATIAASMLLGFYEIMTADHSKWNTHLAGARQLFLEVDFASMVRQYREMKVERSVRLHQQAHSGTPAVTPSAEDLALDDLVDVNEQLISQLYGEEVRYGQQHFVEQAPVQPRLDLNRFEIMKDLFWWYCKQDAYQSLISGNPPLMDFSRWTACPPRAPMNMPDRVYGTFDHLILLLGRIAAFSAKDRERKLSEMRRNGGQWVPHPASRMARAQAPTTPMPQPAFYGMTPAPQSHRMPASYQSLDGITSPVIEQDEWTIEMALEEHERIHEALRLFKANLGPAFHPVTEGEMTPFGTALHYATTEIGCMWSIYNSAVIVIIRSHPFYHPAAHVAAGMATMETVSYANEVGRIAAGILPGPPDAPLDPTHASSLVESCMPSFFAAIQYSSPEQRHATVTRIFTIARKTGWGTADLIANGCETAWVKAAQNGRGPPYERLLRAGVLTSPDARLNGRLDDLNGQPEQDTDRRFVREKPIARLHWAIGLIGTENDI